jgi:hypothetical protein
MRYKIEIRTYASGRKGYTPLICYVKENIFGRVKEEWYGLSIFDNLNNTEYDSREKVLDVIDKHYQQKLDHEEVSIEIEYLNK